MNIDVFLEDTSSGILRMMQAAQKPTAVIQHKNKDGSLKAATIVLYYDEPKHNQRIVDLILNEGRLIDQEDNESGEKEDC
jgi:hypothetical protein